MKRQWLGSIRVAWSCSKTTSLRRRILGGFWLGCGSFVNTSVQPFLEKKGWRFHAMHFLSRPSMLSSFVRMVGQQLLPDALLGLGAV